LLTSHLSSRKTLGLRRLFPDQTPVLSSKSAVGAVGRGSSQFTQGREDKFIGKGRERHLRLRLPNRLFIVAWTSVHAFCKSPPIFVTGRRLPGLGRSRRSSRKVDLSADDADSRRLKSLRTSLGPMLKWSLSRTVGRRISPRLALALHVRRGMGASLSRHGSGRKAEEIPAGRETRFDAVFGGRL